MSSSINPSPVVVIGAGPVGLAAAAELAERGIDFVVLESGRHRRRRDQRLGSCAAVQPVALQPRPGRTATPRGRRLDRPRPRRPADRR